MVPRSDTYEYIYKHASELLAKEGVYFPFSKLQATAKKGSGGLRHYFANKDALLARFAQDQFDEEKRWVAVLASRPDAGAAPEEWAVQLSEWLSATLGLSDVLAKSRSNAGSALKAVFEDIRKQTQELVEPAKSAGWLRRDVDAGDVVSLILAAVSAADCAREGSSLRAALDRRQTASRNVKIVMAGLRAEPADAIV